MIQTAVATHQDLTPGLALCQTTFEFKVLRGDVTELLVDHDPDLTVNDVAVLQPRKLAKPFRQCQRTKAHQRSLARTGSRRPAPRLGRGNPSLQ